MEYRFKSMSLNNLDIQAIEINVYESFASILVYA